MFAGCRDAGNGAAPGPPHRANRKPSSTRQLASSVAPAACLSERCLQRNLVGHRSQPPDESRFAALPASWPLGLKPPSPPLPAAASPLGLMAADLSGCAPVDPKTTDPPPGSRPSWNSTGKAGHRPRRFRRMGAPPVAPACAPAHTGRVSAAGSAAWAAQSATPVLVPCSHT